MIIHIKLIVINLIFLSGVANSIVISDSRFILYGGDINNSQQTYKKPYRKLFLISLWHNNLRSVGRISGPIPYKWSTGTWLGNTSDNKYVIILTAAHAVPRTNNGETNLFFQDYRGEMIGEGGNYYILPKNPNSSSEPYSNDIAILKLKKIRDILGRDGKPIPPPTLNNVPDEEKKPVGFVGYGFWGTVKDGVQENWQLLRVPFHRRAWGQSEIRNTISNGFALLAEFSNNSKSNWARVEEGDSGGSWWQEDNNGSYIVGVTYGKTSQASYATRIQPHKAWIRAVAPEVKWRSNRCYWLTYKNSIWLWQPYEVFGNEKSCLKANQCNNGGGCFKWDAV